MKNGKVLLSLIGLGVVGTFALAAWAAQEGEEQVTLEQVPAAVKATILKEAAGGKITEIERETKNGKTIYEAEFLRDGREIEIKVAPDGTFLGREVEDDDDDDREVALRIDQVPEPARAALLKLAGGATILKAEREREHGVLVYEAEWTANGVEHEAAVTAEGALIETEQIVSIKDLPAAARAAVAKHFPADAELKIEKKMVVIYEVEARINGKERELIVFPTGRVHEGHGDADDDHDDDDDDDDDHGEHDDDDEHGHHDDGDEDHHDGDDDD